MEYRASLLASHGYAVMALHYIDSSRVTSADTEMETFEVCVVILHSDLLNFVCFSQAECKAKQRGFLGLLLFVVSKYFFRMEYFSSYVEFPNSSTQTAFSFLKDHPQVISDKVGMFGFSSGSVVTIFLMAESAVVKASNSAHNCNAETFGVVCGFVER